RPIAERRPTAPCPLASLGQQRPDQFPELVWHQCLGHHALRGSTQAKLSRRRETSGTVFLLEALRLDPDHSSSKNSSSVSSVDWGSTARQAFVSTSAMPSRRARQAAGSVSGGVSWANSPQSRIMRSRCLKSTP